MSTPAATPAPTTISTTGTITLAAAAEVKAAETWLQKHERIVIVFLILLSATWLGNKWLNISADRARSASQTTTQTLNTQKATDKEIDSSNVQLAAQYRTLAAKLSSENAKLTAIMAKRTKTTAQQQVADTTMPVSDLAKHWADLAGFDPKEIVPETNGVAVSDTGARQTVEQLEKVPELTANLKDETTVAENRQQELDKADLLVGGLNSQVTALNLTVTDETNACKAEISSVKAADRKGKLAWFKRGLIVGFVGGLVVGRYIP